MSDLLDSLVRASREAPVPHDEAAETRRRILAAAKRTAHTRSGRRVAPWVLPLVAALAATGAFAAGPLGMSRLVSSVGEETLPVIAVVGTLPAERAPLAFEKPTAPEIAAPVVAPPIEPAVTEAPLLVPALLPKAAAPAITPAASLPHAAVRPRAATVAKPIDVPPAPREVAIPHEAAAPVLAAALPPAVDPADGPYRAAHDLHFRGGDPASAVEAWNRYLLAAPRGRFAVEARYNRALALLKAGRRNDGLGALQPFANGVFGEYRREEARRLLEAGR